MMVIFFKLGEIINAIFSDDISPLLLCKKRNPATSANQSGIN